MTKIAKRVVAKNTETKVKTSSLSSVSIPHSSLTPYIASFNDIAQGVGQDQRIGNQIKVTSCKYDLFFTQDQVANSSAVRLLFYIPRDPNNLILNLGYNQAADLDDYVILKDMFIPLSYGGPACVRKQGWVSFRKRGKSNGLTTQFSTAANNSQSKNRICIYCVSDSITAPHPLMNGFFRCFYKDA